MGKAHSSSNPRQVPIYVMANMLVDVSGDYAKALQRWNYQFLHFAS